MGPELLKNLVIEAAERLYGGVVKKVHQPDNRTLILRIFARGRESRLLISTHPLFCRFHITEERPENPSAPKRFCALLRARLTGAKLTGIEQTEGERVVKLSFKSGFEKSGLDSSESGGSKAEAVGYTLVVELTGKSANAILIDSGGIVLDALKWFEPGVSKRAVTPGVYLEALSSKPPEPDRPGSIERAKIERINNESWNEAVDRQYTGLVNEESEGLERANFKRSLNKARKRAARKLRNLTGDREVALKGEEQRYFGELLLANRQKMTRGAKVIEADDYTVVPPVKVTVALDEKIGPQENIERYFKKARKAKRALKMLSGRIPKTECELEQIETLLYDLETVATEAEFDEYKEGLIKAGFLKKESRKRVKRVMDRKGARESRSGKGGASGAGSGADPFRRYTSSEGFTVLCGKSGAANDRLVKREAANEDIWFHAEGVPGSHVLIKVAGRAKELTRVTLEEAAGLAAFYSKAKESGLVEVIYAEARFVKKPRGAKPGSVTVSEHRSLKVRPKEMEAQVMETQGIETGETGTEE